MERYTLKDHEKAVGSIADSVKSFSKSRTPFRINHGSTNSTRVRDPSTPQLHIGHLNHILEISRDGRFAWAEPNVPLDALVIGTLKINLMPLTVMEFPGITIGGGFSGASGESTGWKEGLFDCCITEIEMVLGNGDILRAEKGGRNSDLFDAARCSLGTMGVVTMLKVQLTAAPGAVQLTYHHTTTFKETADKLTQMGDQKDADFDFLEGIMYSREHGVIISGRHVDPKSLTITNLPQVRFDRAKDPWFYLHAANTTNGYSDLCPIQTYLFRHDRGAFWSGESVLRYWGLRNTRFMRWVINPVVTARAIYRAMIAAQSADTAIIQDLLIPSAKCEDFFEYVASELDIWPLWLCPIRKHREDKKAIAHPFYDTCGDMTINFGVWGQLPEEVTHESVRRINRRMEEKLKELRAVKVPYAANFYSESEFWDLCYDREEYARLRTKWHATALPSIFDKVYRKHDEGSDDEGQEISLWLWIAMRVWPWEGLWPLGGLWQFYIALFK